MDDQLKAFDALLDKTVRAPRLSGSKVTELKEMSTKLVAYDHHIVTALLRLNTSLPPASSMRISNLYVFDAIARAAKTDIEKGIGRTVSKERGKGTQAGLLSKMEGVVDSIVEGMVDDGKGGVWVEGRDKTRKIIEIWRKSNTFPDECIKQLTARIGSASTPAGMSPAIRSPRGGSKPARSTTPTAPPPLHVIERYGIAAAAAAAASAQEASSSSNSPPAASAPAQSHLPPEIMALLGVKNPGSVTTDKPPSNNAALDTLLANVRKSTVSSSTPPAPSAAAPPNLDPAQLAALANITALTKAAPPAPPAPYSNLPPRPNGSAYNQDYNGRYGDRERARSRSPNARDPRNQRGNPPAHRDYNQDYRQDRGYDRREPQQHQHHQHQHQQQQHQHEQSHPQQQPQHLPPKPQATLPPRPAPGPPPAPHGARSPPPRDAGWAKPPAVNTPAGQGGLSSFDLTTFNPTSPESWAALGAAWKVTTGRDPNQMELMGFLATGQIPDPGAMGMMGMNGNGMGGMGGMGMGMGQH